ncbi:MAG: MBL fold metallo-hydrolase [Pseudomonadota bacterium]
MTAQGTNTYLLGEKQHLVIDPGPVSHSHIDAILAATNGEISHIICTHTHPDHSPASKPLAEITGASVLGARPESLQHQDETFEPDEELAHGVYVGNSEVQLLALHTPGHVGNHFCFLLEPEGLLFSGDHVMSGSTVVIVPPEGSMRDYLASLRLLKAHEISRIAPAHGELIDDPMTEIQRVINHRLAREQKVVDALTGTYQTLDELVKVVYSDVPDTMHEWAKLSLEAHLLKLRDDERAEKAVKTEKADKKDRAAGRGAGSWRLAGKLAP